MSYLPVASQLKQKNDKFFNQKINEQIDLILRRIIFQLFRKYTNPYEFDKKKLSSNLKIDVDKIIIEYKSIRDKWCDENEKWEYPTHYEHILKNILTKAQFNPIFTKGFWGKTTYWFVIIDNPFYNLSINHNEDLINKTINPNNYKDIERFNKL